MTTVLIVDDSVLDQQIAGACVKEIGCDVAYAASGREALDAIQRDPPDVVLTDLQMPEGDGLELVARVKQRSPNIPVVLMTAYGSEQIAAEALRAGAASYVPKQSLNQGLAAAMRAVLSAIAVSRQRDQVRSFLEESNSRFALAYEPGGPQALISYLQDKLTGLNFCDESTLLRLATVLTEAIANAIDHGNLELDSSLRESDDNAYSRLGKERAKQPPYCDRRVRVLATLTPSEATFVIRDEGPGFDPSTLPDPTDPENLLRPSGRGIMLMRTFLDEVKFNEQGNEVTLVKRRESSRK